MKSTWRKGVIVLVIGALGILLSGADAGEPDKTATAAKPLRQTAALLKAAVEQDLPVQNAFRLLFDVIAVQLPDEQVKALDGSPESRSTKALLAQACAEGRARVVQSFDVPHVVRRETRMSNGERRPYVTAVAETNQGHRATVHQAVVSCGVSVATDWLETESGSQIRCDWHVHHSSMIEDEHIKRSENVNSHILTELKQEFCTVQRPGQTRLYGTLTGRRTTPDEGEEAVLFVYRSTFLPLE